MRRFPPGVHLAGGRNSAPVNRALAAAFDARVLPLVLALRSEGLSLRAVARELERRRVPTRYEAAGGRWHGRQVARILSRARRPVL
jgi:hypothetical protein